MSAEQETWAKIELLGHVTIYGRLTEEEKFGSKIGRIDVPHDEPCGCPNPTLPTVECVRCHGAGFVRGFGGRGLGRRR